MNYTFDMFNNDIENIIFHIDQAKFASLIYNTGQTIQKPHFYGRKIDKTLDPAWVNFW